MKLINWIGTMNIDVVVFATRHRYGRPMAHIWSVSSTVESGFYGYVWCPLQNRWHRPHIRKILHILNKICISMNKITESRRNWMMMMMLNRSCTSKRNKDRRMTFNLFLVLNAIHYWILSCVWMGAWDYVTRFQFQLIANKMNISAFWINRP